MRPVITRLRTRAYQFSLRTGKAPEEVLGDFAQRPMPGIAVAERGPNYLVLRPQQRRRYGGDVAVMLGLAIVLAVLILTAVTPVFIVLLPLALLPGVPLLIDNRPDLAISAVADELGGTRVTVHGQASSELAAALDAYLGSLPRLSLENIGSGPQGSSGPLLPPLLEQADHRDNDAFELELARVDRFHGAVLGLETDASQLAEEALDGHLTLARRLVLDPGDDDRAVGGRRLLWAHHHDVTVADSGVDHALAVHRQRV